MIFESQIATKILISLSVLFWAAVWGYGIGLLLAWVLRWWTGDQFMPVRMFNYLMPWCFLGLLAGIALALMSNRNLLALVLVVPSFLILAAYAPLLLSGQEKPAAGFPLKVMTYNVWRENSNVIEMAKVIRNQNPDLILLQEIHQDKLRALIAELDDLYLNEPNVTFEKGKLQAVISHFPVRQINTGNGKGRAQKVIISTPSGPITVLNIHPSRGRWQRKHREMSRLIAEEIVGEVNPLILGGDFNTTDQSQTYRLFEPMLKNAHWQAGWGFGFTYPSSNVKFLGKLSVPPLVRIDHIFYSHHFVAGSASTLSDSGGSDHYPAIAELTLTME